MTTGKATHTHVPTLIKGLTKFNLIMCPSWVTYLHAALEPSPMKAFPFVINCNLSEEQSLRDLIVFSPHHNSICKTNEQGGNWRQTKITFPIKALVSVGSQRPPALLNCLTVLISPFISLPVEKPPERSYLSTNRAHLM